MSSAPRRSSNASMAMVDHDCAKSTSPTRFSVRARSTILMPRIEISGSFSPLQLHEGIDNFMISPGISDGLQGLWKQGRRAIGATKKFPGSGGGRRVAGPLWLPCGMLLYAVRIALVNRTQSLAPAICSDRCRQPGGTLLSLQGTVGTVGIALEQLTEGT